MKASVLFIWISIISQHALIGQQTLDFEYIMEQYFPVLDKDINYEEMYELLYQFYQSPLNLNTADANSLRSLNILTIEQLNSFLNYRENNGRLLSIFELQAVPLFDLNTIEKIQPFVRIVNTSLNTDNRGLLSKILDERNSYLIIRTDRPIQTKEGYKQTETTADYLGSPYRLYSKLRIQHTNDFSLGFTMEKDAGEQFKWSPSNKQYLMDYYSYHFQIKYKGILKNLVLGDYQIQYGQSLIFGSGFSLGKGAHAIATARRPNSGINPYGSVIEKNFFRGIGSTFQLSRNWELTSFYSYNKLDAQIINDSLNNQKYIESINSSGLHNTAALKDRKNNTSIQHTGVTLLFTSNNKYLNAGMNYLYTAYEYPIDGIERKYNQYNYSGKAHSVSSIFANYYWRNTHLFSELAYSQNKGIGLISGLIVSLSEEIQISLLGRHYSKEFYSPMGSAFGESSNNNNESGIYIGFRNAINRRLTITAYIDKYKSPWLQYLVDKPASGHEFLGRLNYMFNKKTILYFQYRYKSEEKNELDEQSKTYKITNADKRHMMVNLDIRTHPLITLKSRIQYSDYHKAGERTDGIAFIQDIGLNFNKITINGRYAIFDTNDFENRQYAYEKDVLYAFSIPAYQNTGTRTYLLLQYRMSKNIKVWAKWSQFRYFGIEEIGTGNEKIEGDTKSDIKFQILFKL